METLTGGKTFKARSLNEGLPAHDAEYVVVDTELTGLDEKKDGIISIGAVRIRDGRISLGEVFYKLANPEKFMTRKSVVIHGITPSDIGAEPSVDEVVYEFVKFCGDAVIVGHCASLDLSFINREMRRITGSPLPNRALDTIRLHQWLMKRVPAYRGLFAKTKDEGLYTIAGKFDISANGAHNAEMDAFITAQLFQRFLPMLSEAGIRTVGEILKAGDPYKGGDNLSNTCGISNF